MKNNYKIITKISLALMIASNVTPGALSVHQETQTDPYTPAPAGNLHQSELSPVNVGCAAAGFACITPGQIAALIAGVQSLFRNKQNLTYESSRVVNPSKVLGMAREISEKLGKIMPESPDSRTLNDEGNNDAERELAKLIIEVEKVGEMIAAI